MSIMDLLPAAGFVLLCENGTEHNRIRGDLIPHSTIVVVEDGRSFVRTGRRNAFDFAIYQEGFETFVYHSDGA